MRQMAVPQTFAAEAIKPCFVCPSQHPMPKGRLVLHLKLVSKLPSPRAEPGLLCEDGCSLSQHLCVDPTSDRHTDVSEPTCLASKDQHPNLMKPAVALSHSSSPCAPHHAETRLCLFLPLPIFFIANIVRKRPELKRDKTTQQDRALFPGALGSEHFFRDLARRCAPV